MARDYARRKTPARQSAPAPAWVWVLLGFLLGSVGMGLLWLKLSLPRTIADSKPVASEQPIAQAKAKTPPAPHFDFYKLLPAMKVVVPTTPAHTTTAKKNPAQVTPARPENYMLQLASFKHYRDADRLKANLALRGVNVHIKKTTMADGTIWFRVYKGPFPSRQAATLAQTQLDTFQIKSLLLKMAG